jgi:hypothetical protein
MSAHAIETPEDQSALETEWRYQERLLGALRSGGGAAPDDPNARLYRDVMMALREDYSPALPDDFVARVDADAQRLADARQQIARFKRVLAMLLSCLYLPAMLLVAVVYGADLLPMLQRALQQYPGPATWIAASVVFAALFAGLDLWMRRSAPDVGID